jgi:hypothetical protein
VEITPLTPRKLDLKLEPAIAIGLIFIGTIVIIAPEDTHPQALLLSLIATSITVVFVHFLADLFLGTHLFNHRTHTFSQACALEAQASGRLVGWVFPSLLPTMLFAIGVFDYGQAVTITAVVIAGLAAILGFLVAWSRGHSLLFSLLMALVATALMSLALSFEVITDLAIGSLH